MAGTLSGRNWTPRRKQRPVSSSHPNEIASGYSKEPSRDNTSDGINDNGKQPRNTITMTDDEKSKGKKTKNLISFSRTSRLFTSLRSKRTTDIDTQSNPNSDIERDAQVDTKETITNESSLQVNLSDVEIGQDGIDIEAMEEHDRSNPNKQENDEVVTDESSHEDYEDIGQSLLHLLRDISDVAREISGIGDDSTVSSGYMSDADSLYFDDDATGVNSYVTMSTRTSAADGKMSPVAVPCGTRENNNGAEAAPLQERQNSLEDSRDAITRAIGSPSQQEGKIKALSPQSNAREQQAPPEPLPKDSIENDIPEIKIGSLSKNDRSKNDTAVGEVAQNLTEEDDLLFSLSDVDSTFEELIQEMQCDIEEYNSLVSGENSLIDETCTGRESFVVTPVSCDGSFTKEPQESSTHESQAQLSPQDDEETLLIFEDTSGSSDDRIPQVREQHLVPALVISP